MSISKMRQESGLLTEYWYAAALSEQVKHNKPISRVVMGEMIALWRKKDGTAAALKDRCLHRNAVLSEGRLKDDCLICPYHGWTFDEHGKCVNVPSEGPSGVPKKLRKLETFPTVERYGLIWVWMGKEKTPDKEPFEMPYYNEDGWGSYYMETDFPNNVTNLVENFMDVPHTVFVHQGWFRDRKVQKVPMTVERTEDSVLVTYDQPKDEIGFQSMILNPKRLPMVHTDKFYMPNNTRVDYIYGDTEQSLIITSTCTPVSEYETRVYTLISYKLGMMNAVAKRLLPWYTRQVIEQDVEIMEIQSRGIKHYESEQFMSTPADRLHIHIEALRKWAQDGGTRRKPSPKVDVVEFWI